MRRFIILIGLSLLVAVVFAGGVSAEPEQQRNFVAKLNTAEEVPEPSNFNRNPQGLAKFQLSKDGTELHYKLIVANIENVMMAHIHGPAPVGDTAGVVAWLYPSGPPPQLIEGRFSGVLAEGVITDADLVGNLAGQTVADLVAMIQDGDAYVNVHTQQNPPGEIRGQIR
jgi:hypothetical protein